MEVRGEHRFAAARQATWEALLDPRSIESALPGCESFRATAPGEYDVTLRVGIAAIKGTYEGTVRVLDQQPHDSYRLAVTGVGKAGRVRGSALITLHDSSDGTVVQYVADVIAQGTLARLGSRLLTGAAKLLASQFFRAMESEGARRGS